MNVYQRLNMRILSITLENFRSFKDITQFKFKQVNVMVGANKVGKSNVIEALMFLRELTRDNWYRPFNDVVFDKKGEEIKIAIEFELSKEERQQIINWMKGIDHLFTGLDLDERGFSNG